MARVFPAFDRPRLTGSEVARVQTEGESSCFYHPSNQAATSCETCGRFLCTLCDIDLDGRHLCPSCLERGVTVEKTDSLEDRRTQYDSAALHLLSWPLFTFWFPIFTAPAALYLVIRHWNTPMSILPRTRFRLWLALLLAVGQILGYGVLIFWLIWLVPRIPKQ
jgi:hypothetical protein